MIEPSAVTPPASRSLSFSVHLERQAKVEPTPNVLRIAAMFGLGADAKQTVTILPQTKLCLSDRTLTFITGPSGGGKSSFIKVIAESVVNFDDVHVIDFASLATLPDQPLVDSFCSFSNASDDEKRLRDALQWMNRAGLSDAFAWLRRPCELSDGQRYRASLAHAMALIDIAPSNTFHVLLADEFGASLDRVTAKIVSRNVRRWITQTPNAAVVVATTHDDLLESLHPDTLIEKYLGSELHVYQKEMP